MTYDKKWRKSNKVKDGIIDFTICIIHLWDDRKQREMEINVWIHLSSWETKKNEVCIA